MNIKFKHYLWSSVVGLSVLLTAGGCTVANQQSHSNWGWSAPNEKAQPTLAATPLSPAPHDVVAMVVVPTVAAVKPVTCAPVQESASIKAEDAQAHFELGVHYFMEAQQTARESMLRQLLFTSEAEIAHNHFNRAIELDPKLARAYVYRAATASLQGADAETVMADLNKAAVLDSLIYNDVRLELQHLATRISSQVAAINIQGVKIP